MLCIWNSSEYVADWTQMLGFEPVLVEVAMDRVQRIKPLKAII